MVGESATIGEREGDLVPERMGTLRTLIGELVAGEVAGATRIGVASGASCGS